MEKHSEKHLLTCAMPRNLKREILHEVLYKWKDDLRGWCGYEMAQKCEWQIKDRKKLEEFWKILKASKASGSEIKSFHDTIETSDQRFKSIKLESLQSFEGLTSIMTIK